MLFDAIKDNMKMDGTLDFKVSFERFKEKQLKYLGPQISSLGFFNNSKTLLRDANINMPEVFSKLFLYDSHDEPYEKYAKSMIKFLTNDTVSMNEFKVEMSKFRARWQFLKFGDINSFGIFEDNKDLITYLVTGNQRHTSFSKESDFYSQDMTPMTYLKVYAQTNQDVQFSSKKEVRKNFSKFMDFMKAYEKPSSNVSIM